jgi:Spy/CpxP family protein refolding chaperone
MKLKTCITVLLVTASITTMAQPVPRKGVSLTENPTGKSPTLASSEPGRTALLQKSFFAPELVMQHQNAIGLTAEQTTAIRAEMQKMITRFTDLQWQQSAETEAMAALVKQERPDEKQVLAQLDKLLSVENEIKRLHTGMLTRIKNILSSNQQAQLREMTTTGTPRPRVAGEKAGR